VNLLNVFERGCTDLARKLGVNSSRITILTPRASCENRFLSCDAFVAARAPHRCDSARIQHSLSVVPRLRRFTARERERETRSIFMTQRTDRRVRRRPDKME